MIETKENNADFNIDWGTLDKVWADHYEEDYGSYFSHIYFYATGNPVHTSSQIEQDIVN